MNNTLKPYIGARVRVIAVTHPVFNRHLGEEGEITKFLGGLAWVRPVALQPRKTRRGVIMERPNHEVLYGLDQIEVLS